LSAPETGDGARALSTWAAEEAEARLFNELPSDLRLRVRVTNLLAIVMEAERSFIDHCGRELEELRALHKDRRRMDKARPARRRVAA
jgi:hypothetical protein